MYHKNEKIGIQTKVPGITSGLGEAGAEGKNLEAKLFSCCFYVLAKMKPPLVDNKTLINSKLFASEEELSDFCPEHVKDYESCVSYSHQGVNNE